VTKLKNATPTDERIGLWAAISVMRAETSIVAWTLRGISKISKK
jgi:hypothetical protein